MRRDWLAIVGRALFWLALLAAIVPRGAVTPLSVTFACILASLAALAGVMRPLERATTRRMLMAAVLLATVEVTFVAFQAMIFDGNPLANPVWKQAATLVGATGASISVDPAATIAGVPLLILPFLLFVAALSLFRTDDDALQLLTGVGVLGAGFAAFGLVQVTLLPTSLLFYEKKAYLDSLTSVFVNRNTAGTLLGLAALNWLGLLSASLSRLRAGRSRSDSASAGRATFSRIAGAAFVLCLVALFATKSRGALLSTVVALAVVTPFLLGTIVEGVIGARRPIPWLASAWSKIALVLVGVALLVALFGGQALFRMEARGLDVTRLCAYAATWRGFLDNWIAGVGFGTFAEAYPRYRDASCGSPYEVLIRAHNVFLEGLFTLGIAFVPLTLFAYWRLIASFATGLRSRRRLVAAPLMGLGGIVLVTLHGLTDFSLQIPGLAAYFAVFLGGAVTISLGRADKD